MLALETVRAGRQERPPLSAARCRAFDADLVGVAPNLRVHVSRSLLEDEDGPMLDVLKGFHGTTNEAPKRRLWRPDPDRLAVRFERVSSAA